MVSWQNQQQPPYGSEFPRQPSTTAHSEYNSTNGSSSDYHAQAWVTPASTPRLGVNAPWTEGPNAPESPSGEMSGTSTRLGRQNTKARYLTATQREEVAWEAKRREAQTVGTSRAGVSNTDAGVGADAGNGGRAGWAADDLGPADPTVPAGIPDLPPPAYSELQPHGGPQAM